MYVVAGATDVSAASTQCPETMQGFFCHLFGMSGLPLSVFVVESALPVVTQVTVLAGAYGADEKYAATGACLSTLASFITIPILMLVLG